MQLQVAVQEGIPLGPLPTFFELPVSKIFYFHPYLGKIPILTNIFQMGWKHQPVLLIG